MSSILSRFPTAGLLPAATVLFLSCAAAAGAGDWKGSESTVEGQLHVKNPAEAIDPEMEIELEEVDTEAYNFRGSARPTIARDGSRVSDAAT